VLLVVCLAGSYVLLTYVTIQQLPFGQGEAMDWFLGRPQGVVVVGEGEYTGEPLPASAYALDTGQIADWFGGHITSPFHDPTRAYHGGVDVSLVAGTPIPAAMAGQVVYAGWNDQGYGNLVIVQNGSWTTYYGHLSTVGVAVGQEVGRGETVALSGNTGNSTGPHLH
jgi:murein DD-endopeptidase MepM/ murein hydrolase activator NlpD